MTSHLKLLRWILAATVLLVLGWVAFAHSGGRKTLNDTLLDAVERNDIKGVKAILDKGANVDGLPESTDPEGVSPLTTAAGEGKAKIVRLLIDRGANINMRDGWWDSPLKSAAEENRIEVMRLLISRGAKVNDNDGDSDALWGAATSGKKAAVIELLRHGANPNTKAYTTVRDDPLLHALECLNDPHMNDLSQVIAVLKRAGAKDHFTPRK